MCEKFTLTGGEIRLSTPAATRARINGTWQIYGEEYDAIISTLPPQVTNSLMGNSSDKLPDLMCQGAACMTLGLARDPTNDIYWTNMGDTAPYGAVVTHTNFVPFE